MTGDDDTFATLDLVDELAEIGLRLSEVHGNHGFPMTIKLVTFYRTVPYLRQRRYAKGEQVVEGAELVELEAS